MILPSPLSLSLSLSLFCSLFLKGPTSVVARDVSLYHVSRRSGHVSLSLVCAHLVCVASRCFEYKPTFSLARAALPCHTYHAGRTRQRPSKGLAEPGHPTPRQRDWWIPLPARRASRGGIERYHARAAHGHEAKGARRVRQGGGVDTRVWTETPGFPCACTQIARAGSVLRAFCTVGSVLGALCSQLYHALNSAR